MEALSVETIPEGGEWQYEPKWDGFRCLAFRDGEKVELQSKSKQPLARYFPELVKALASVKAKQFVLDGEITIPKDGAFSFDALLQRIHPAPSRIKKLSEKTPAILIAFDLLADARGKSLLNVPLKERRSQLESFSAENFDSKTLRLSPATTRINEARQWLEKTGETMDGIVAKRRDLEYRSGERDGMQKIKNYRSADCVIGGFRYGANRKQVASLLLGMYDDEGLLHHVGFTSAIANIDRKAMTEQLERMVEEPGFTGRAPGGPSRWNQGKSNEWHPITPRLVIEVCYDHATGDRFRHGTRILRWRPDKAPQSCKIDQLQRESANLLRLLQ